MSSIRMIPQSEFKVGPCVVCSSQAILKWRDAELPDPGTFGDCCLSDVKKADEVMQTAFKYKGVVRPAK